MRGNGHACVPFTFRDGTKGEWGYRIVFSMLVIRMSLKVPEGLKIAVKDDRCYIYLDEDNTIGLYPDYDGEILERSGDYHYYLNTEDFFNMGGYCFYTTDLSDGVFLVQKAREQGWELEALQLEATELTMHVGEEYVLRFNSSADAVWELDDDRVLSLEEGEFFGDRKLKARKKGRAVVTAEIYGKEYTCKVEVVE